MDQAETKPCIACFTPINAKARKCGHCHQIQSKVAGLVNHPWTSWVVFTLSVLFFLVALYSILQSTRKESFAAQLVVGESQLRVSTPGETSSVSCFAQVKNVDVATWGNPSLQAEFFDQSKKLIDVHYAKERFDVYPTFSFQARVSGRMSASASEYASCKIQILSAS